MRLAEKLLQTFAPEDYKSMQHFSGHKLSAVTHIAHAIDRELQLPQRTTALLCAQSVVDDVFHTLPHPRVVSVDRALMDLLRSALANIKSKES